MSTVLNEKSENAHILIGATLFQYAGEISPERTPDGSVRAYMPQAQYSKASTAKLHKHGAGPFCRFTVAKLQPLPAVYIIALDGVPQYVGETINLFERFGPRGYGVIHARNCYAGGQPTNCKVNNNIYAAVSAGETAALYVHYTPSHKAVESAIRRSVRLPWNGV